MSLLTFKSWSAKLIGSLVFVALPTSVMAGAPLSRAGATVTPADPPYRQHPNFPGLLQRQSKIGPRPTPWVELLPELMPSNIDFCVSNLIPGILRVSQNVASPAYSCAGNSSVGHNQSIACSESNLAGSEKCRAIVSMRMLDFDAKAKSCRLVTVCCPVQCP